MSSKTGKLYIALLNGNIVKSTIYNSVIDNESTNLPLNDHISEIEIENVSGCL